MALLQFVGAYYKWSTKEGSYRPNAINCITLIIFGVVILALRNVL